VDSTLARQLWQWTLWFRPSCSSVIIRISSFAVHSLLYYIYNYRIPVFVVLALE